MLGPLCATTNSIHRVRVVTKQDIEDLFRDGGLQGEIKEIKLMNGFGFAELSDPNDAGDAVSRKN